MIVSYLPDPEAHPLWEGIKALLKPAVSGRPVIEAGEVLWIAHNDGILFGAGTTALSENEDAAIVLTCGGMRHREWVNEALRVVEAWARDAGASRLTMRGRRGWTRALSAAGWDALGTNEENQTEFQKELRG